MSPAAGEKGEGRWGLGASILIGTLFILVAVVAPLLPDEMYYWDWSRHPAGGYFDHPRMIAAAIHLGTVLAGSSTFGVRLVPLVCGVITLLALSGSARMIAGHVAVARLRLIVFGMPLITASFLLATPDAPFLAATAVALWGSLRAIRSTRPFDQITWWMASGAFVGLALQSKYTAFLLLPALGLGLLRDPGLRRLLLTPGPWLALGMAALLAGPMLRWNADHDWASLGFQMSHGLGAATGGNSALRELSFLGGQIAIVNPVLVTLLAFTVWRAVRAGHEAAERFLGVVAIVIFGAFVISASRRSVEANWPAAAYLPALVLLSAAPLGTRALRWLKIGSGLGMMLTIIAQIHLLTPILPLAREVDQIAESYGWDRVAGEVAKIVSSDSGPAYVAGNRYQETAALAWHLAGHPAVYSLNVDYRPNQYDYWPRFEQVAQPGARLLLVIEPGTKADSVLDRLRPSFDSVRLVERVQRFRGRRELSSRDLWLLLGWNGRELPRGFRP